MTGAVGAFKRTYSEVTTERFRAIEDVYYVSEVVARRARRRKESMVDGNYFIELYIIDRF